MGAMQRRKGGRIEREIVNLHKAADIHAERVPLSGAAHYKSEAHDIDVYPRDGLPGRDAPLCCEVKARRAFPKWLLEMLGDNDALFLRADRAEPLVILPWRTWKDLMR